MPLSPTLATPLPPLSLHPATTPPPTRMRRTGRRSPDARLERAAPSSISTTEFSDLPTRSSLSSIPPHRNRATSHSPPPPGTHMPEASGSRTRRHLDPDQHWLSEDEATGSIGGTNAARQRTTGRRRGVQRGFGSDDENSHGRKQRLDDILGPRTARTSHEIHHRPSKIAASTNNNIPIETLSDPAALAIALPRLVSLLSCPHCHELLSEPITFGCGHTRCRGCPKDLSTTFSSSIEPPLVTAFTLTPPLSTASSQGFPPFEKDRANPLASHLPGTFPDHLPSPAPSEAPTSPRTSMIASSPPTCGISDCRHAEFNPLPSTFLNGPKTDYNLRKVLDHVRRAISDHSTSSILQHSKPAMVEEPAQLHALTQTDSGAKDKAVARVPSDSSASSGGGEEETKGEDDSKRVHKSKHGFKPIKAAKKTRRLSEHAVDLDEDHKPSTILEPPPISFPLPSSDRLSDLATTFFADVQAETECQVCVQLFHEPITSPCGHSFCQNCLARAYDHSVKCPLCRADLPPLPYFHRERTNIALRSVVETAFPTLAAERSAAIREEELAHMSNVPIFICTTAWPGIPTFLHIFEPRYRLMMRRALESPSREFGMVLPNRDGLGGVNQYGTMLRITSCNVMDDGRSIINSVGTWRFKIVDRWMVDGYNVGKVERVDDVSLEQELELEQAALRSNEHEFSEYRDPDPPGGVTMSQQQNRPPMTGNMELAIDQLMQICLDFIRTLKSQSAPWVLQRLNNTGTSFSSLHHAILRLIVLTLCSR